MNKEILTAHLREGYLWAGAVVLRGSIDSSDDENAARTGGGE